MAIWYKDYSLDAINKDGLNTMVGFLDIIITEKGDDFLKGTMPASDKTKQTFGIVHGGANCVLAETLGSIAANLVLDHSKEHAVGLSIHTNHIKAVRNGLITGIAKPIHIGKKTHVWQIKTFNDAGKLNSETQLTMAIISRLAR